MICRSIEPVEETECVLKTNNCFSGISFGGIGGVWLGINRVPATPGSSFQWVKDGGNLDSQVNKNHNAGRHCGGYHVSNNQLYDWECDHTGIEKQLCELDIS